MNKIYKVIWSEARKCYVVVAEIAKNHGKNNVRSIVERLAVKSAQALLEIFSSAKQTTAGSELTVAAQRTAYPRTAAQWIVPLMTVGVLLQTMPGFASTIKDADNKSLTSGGNVHNIYTQQILSNDRVNFGYNRFQEFNITQGDIANMYFHVQNHPEIKSENMVNLVKSKIDIQGTVNAIKDNRIVAITAAMKLGTGLDHFAERFPDRLIDVGIAEEHAATMAAGLAAGGMRPYVAVYASFFQRCYDQMIHDVCMQNLPVVFLNDSPNAFCCIPVHELEFLNQFVILLIKLTELTQNLCVILHLCLEAVGLGSFRRAVGPDHLIGIHQVYLGHRIAVIP